MSSEMCIYVKLMVIIIIMSSIHKEIHTIVVVVVLKGIGVGYVEEVVGLPNSPLSDGNRTSKCKVSSLAGL